MNRRAWFAALLAPVVARLAPKPIQAFDFVRPPAICSTGVVTLADLRAARSRLQERAAQPIDGYYIAYEHPLARSMNDHG